MSSNVEGAMSLSAGNPSEAPPPLRYFDEGATTMRLDLVVGEAEAKARKFAHGTSSTQLNRFFRAAREIERRYDGRTRRQNSGTGEAGSDQGASDQVSADFDEARLALQLLSAKAMYALAKESSRETVSVEFVNFLRAAIAGVSEPRDLKAFIRHFEGVVAYFAFHEASRKRESRPTGGGAGSGGSRPNSGGNQGGGYQRRGRPA